MKKKCINLALIALIAISSSGCVTRQKGMREANARVDFTKSDFTFSGQLTGEGKDTKILGLDLFRATHSSDMGYETSQEGRINLGMIPVIGNYLSDESSFYAMYDLMSKNPGYDVIFYPQYEKHIYKPILGIGFLYKRTTVKAMARLGKIKE